MPKKIDVNVSTLFDLKAELYKKQTEFNKQKSSSEALRSSQYVKSTGVSSAQQHIYIANRLTIDFCFRRALRS